MRIAVDIDGVLADQVTPVLDRVRVRYGVDMDFKDIKSWDENISGTDSDIAKEIESAEKVDRHVREMPVIDGAIDALEKLLEEHEIIIATNRPSHTRTATKHWCEELGIPYKDIHFTREMGKEKLSANLLLDDHPSDVLAFIENRDREAILFDRPWNDSSRVDGKDDVRIVDSWRAVPNIVNEKADQ